MCVCARMLLVCNLCVYVCADIYVVYMYVHVCVCVCGDEFVVVSAQDQGFAGARFDLLICLCVIDSYVCACDGFICVCVMNSYVCV